MNLLPYPRSLRRRAGQFVLPLTPAFHLDPELPRDEVFLPVAGKLVSAAKIAGVEPEMITGPARHPRLALAARIDPNAPEHPSGYTLDITSRGIKLGYREADGLRAGVATLRQLLREYGRALPCLTIRDYADFPRRGVMLDVSRGKVPRVETLIELVDKLADFKINEFQLYTEHTFAYRDYEPVWRGWGPLTGDDIIRLDAYCRRLGIDLVPNQNSFGHLRYWLEYRPLKKLAETSKPWPDQGGAFLRYPATLAPENSGTIPFLRGLYDELLPHFTSQRFNVGCDETWDLGRGQSKASCARKGKGRVYLEFLKKIQGEVARHGRQMMFWGDIILHYPELIPELPPNVIALNWGYEAAHPFESETAIFAESKIPYYVCPGTSTWMTMIGRHDSAFANLQNAAKVGAKNGAIGYLNTDWGDGGHPQPLAVSYLPYLVGAAVSWCEESYDESLLTAVIDRDVFADPAGKTGQAALALGFAHRKLEYTAANVTPLGAVIAAAPPKMRELFCRDGLKYYARIPGKNIRAGVDEIEHLRTNLSAGDPATDGGKILASELDLAARMAVQSGKFMLWQQALAAGKRTIAREMATSAIAELRDLDRELSDLWPSRNKGTPRKCSPFLQWRIDDYRRGKLAYPPDVAADDRFPTSGD